MTLRYIDAIRANDWKATAALMHPAALHQLREYFSMLFDDPNAEAIRRELLGVSNVVEARALSDTALFESLLRLSARSPELSAAYRAAKVQILGQVNEGRDTTHVVYRMQMTLEGAPVTTLDVFSLARSPAGWRGLLKGDMAGMAAAIRASLQREQGLPPSRRP
ncbi:MAG: hypothetical protein ACRET3_12780 [Burkholderiales bacterium]